MKNRKNILLIVGLLSILVLSACASQEVATTEAPVEVLPTNTTAVEETEAVDLSNLTDEEMEALIAEKADGNHTLEFILSQDMTAEEWSTTLDRMISYGAKISLEEKEAIINWLVNR